MGSITALIKKTSTRQPWYFTNFMSACPYHRYHHLPPFTSESAVWWHKQRSQMYQRRISLLRLRHKQLKLKCINTWNTHLKYKTVYGKGHTASWVQPKKAKESIRVELLEGLFFHVSNDMPKEAVTCGISASVSVYALRLFEPYFILHSKKRIPSKIHSLACKNPPERGSTNLSKILRILSYLTLSVRQRL